MRSEVTPGLPLVTIVLPTFNRAGRLPGAIASCLSQTYNNLELIVVDDGSVDETPTIVAEIAKKDSRVQYIRQSNQRIPAALNTGFVASRGEFLTWTSDDNRFHPDALAIMVNALLSRPGVGLVYCAYEAVDGNGNFLYRSSAPGPDTLLEGNCVGPCFMYRREVYAAVGGYDPKWMMVEDYEYWLRIHQRFELFRIPGVSPYDYTWHDERLSSKQLLEQTLLAVRVRMQYASSLNDKLRVLRSGFGAISDSAATEGKWAKAILFALLFVVLEPWRRWKWRVLLKRVRGAFATAATRNVADQSPR